MQQSIKAKHEAKQASVSKQTDKGKASASQAQMVAHLVETDTQVHQAHTHTNTQPQTLKTHIFQLKVSSSVQPLFCLVPFIEAVWWRGPKFDHAFSLDWSPPYLESLFVAVYLLSCLCHALRRERGGGLINLPEYAKLSFKTAAELALTACSAQQCMNMLMNWNRHRPEGQHITGGTDRLIHAVLSTSLLLAMSQPGVEHHQLFIGYFFCKCWNLWTKTLL